MFSDSLAGHFGSAIWSRNPLLGLGLVFGAGAGGYAGVHTYLGSEGTASEKADAARRTGSNYLLYGSLGMTAAVTALPYIPGGLPAAARGVTGMVGKYAQGVRRDLGIGIGRVAERKALMLGTGAAVGAVLGSYLNKNDPEAGARTGAVVGGGVGLATAIGLRSSRAWKGIGHLGRFGAVGLLSGAAFAGASYVSRPRYDVMDHAVREDSGLRSRMNSMNANGDLVLGLHNSR